MIKQLSHHCSCICQHIHNFFVFIELDLSEHEQTNKFAKNKVCGSDLSKHEQTNKFAKNKVCGSD